MPESEFPKFKPHPIRASGDAPGPPLPRAGIPPYAELCVTSNFTFDTTGRSGSNMGWTTHAISFVANSTTSTINFVSDVSASGGSLNAGAALDNVQITAPTVGAASSPVPLTWAQWLAAMLIAVAGGSIFLRRRRS